MFESGKAGMLPVLFGGAGVIGIVVSILLAFLGDEWRHQFAFSWLFAFVYFFTISVGSLFWILVHYATDAEWSVVVRRVLENVASLIPYLAIGFVGVYICAPLLFHWWNLPPGADEVLDKKHAWLNHGAFLVRAVIYFVGMGGIAVAMRNNSINQDKDGHPIYTLRNRRWSFIGIPVLALSLTFAAVDWLMSLDFHWASTMWGVYIFAGGAGAAMCLLVLLVTWLRSLGYLKNVTIEHYHIMGKLMLAFCVFWAYIGFSQYMLIWYANLPEETSYFIRRNTGGWWYLSTILVVGRFFVPLPFLLFQATKKRIASICFVAGWLLVMHLLDLYIVVLPIFHKQGVAASILDVTTVVGIGGILGFLFLKKLTQASLFPIRDPRQRESLSLTN